MIDIQDHIIQNCASFELQFDLVFNNKDLLIQALKHRSYLVVTNEDRPASNERLEFLGDSVLNFTLTEFLYNKYPIAAEGELSKMKSVLVSQKVLGTAAKDKGYGQFILMNFGEEKSGGRERLSVLSDIYESIIGAVYLDLGLEKAKDIIYKDIIAKHNKLLSDIAHKNHKSHLLEYIQSLELDIPIYAVTEEKGPDHEKEFIIQVLSGTTTLGEGKGRNKKQAEQLAAKHALENIEKKRIQL